LPGDGIAGHAPQVFCHTVLADSKSAAAPPAKRKLPAAAVAQKGADFTAFFPISGLKNWFVHGCRFVLLLV
jgi:hypothetical protein